MIKGLRFNIPKKSGQYLLDILYDLDIKKYYWNIIDGEVLCRDEATNYLTEDLFDYDYNISGEELYRKILCSEYYIINVDLRGYNCIMDMENDIKIKTYDDFEKSKCELLVIIIDSMYCELYFKSKKILDYKYKDLCKQNMKPEYITDKNIRYCLNIF